MSWHYLRGQAGESLEDCCTGGEPLPPLKSKITHAGFYCNGKLTDAYLDSLYGTMCGHSTAGRGKGESMSLQPASRVSHLVTKESENRNQTQETCGRKQLELYPRSAQITSCLKMCGEYANTCQWSSETCDELATPLNALPLYRREVPARYISESASGYIPTPTAQDGSGSGTHSLRRRSRGCKHGLNLRDWFRTFFNLVYPPAEATEYMMEYPIGWTDLKPLETGRFQAWLRSHGRC
jgi:hypothetical protein